MKTQKGRCACGKIRYQVMGVPKWTALCHCEDCRRACSAPIVAWMGYTPDAVKWFGELKSRSSSDNGVRSFCPDCGSQLSFVSSRWPGEIHLYAITLDDPTNYSPDLHCYTSEHLDWLPIDNAIPKFPKSAPDVDSGNKNLNLESN
ncbi:MAG: GFA family protein [Amylibacter sp.]